MRRRGAGSPRTRQTYSDAAEWSGGTILRDWLAPRVLELTYTAWDLEPFARDVGYDGPPFRWDPARRFLLRAELELLLSGTPWAWWIVPLGLFIASALTPIAIARGWLLPLL